MRYLKLSIKRRHHQLRVEQWILMLLRILAVALLFLVVARPVLRASGWYSALGGSQQINHLIVVDDSLSMGLQNAQGASRLDQAKVALQEIFSQAGPRDRLTLLSATRGERPLLHQATQTTAASLAELLTTVSVNGAHTKWQQTLASVSEQLEQDSWPFRRVTLLTDLQATGWDGVSAEQMRAWRTPGVAVRVIDVGTEDQPERSLSLPKSPERCALLGVPTPFEATLTNATATEYQGEATLTVDGVPKTMRLPSVPAQDARPIPLELTFNTPGWHTWSLALPDDRLNQNNTVFGAVLVHPQLRVILVDGSPNPEPLAGAADLLALPLTLDVGTSKAFQVEFILEQDWQPGALNDADVVMLCNVAQIGPERAADLQRAVSEGLGLVIFPGEQFDLTSYRQSLWEVDTPLLPGDASEIMEEAAEGIFVADIAESPVASLANLGEEARLQIKARKFLRITPDESTESGSIVLARWNDEQGYPMAAWRRFGRGNVVLFSIPADKSWSPWATEPSFVLCVRELVPRIARAPASFQSVAAGVAWTKELPPGLLPKEAFVWPPASEARIPAELVDGLSGGPTPSNAASSPGLDPPAATSPNSQAGATIVRVPETRLPGIYRVTWTVRTPEADEVRFAANPDPREINLTRTTPAQLSQLFAGVDFSVVPLASPTEQAGGLQRMEGWRLLATFLTVLLAGEFCMAAWCSRER